MFVGRLPGARRGDASSAQLKAHSRVGARDGRVSNTRKGRTCGDWTDVSPRLRPTTGWWVVVVEIAGGGGAAVVCRARGESGR